MTDKLYNHLVRKIELGEPFSFTRWGDGEWSSVLDRSGENCDGHVYYRSLKMALREVLKKNQSYYYGMQPKAQQDMGAEIELWLHSKNLEIPFVNADIFHDASSEELLQKFWKATADKYVVLIAPDTLTMLNMKFNNLHHIEVPIKNAWLEHERILDDCKRVLIKSPPLETVVLFSCGMMANVLIDELWSDYFWDKIMLNMGSVFDPYCGRMTRRYHQEIMKKLGEMKCA